jgi:putative membrane protein
MDYSALGYSLLSTLAFSLVGVFVFGIAFLLMDKLAPFSLRKEIEEDENKALAMIMSSVVLGIALIIMGALLG